MEVRIAAHVYSYYEHNAPTYRIWVNDNLYIEREFWTNPYENYVIENMIIDVEPGAHLLTIEKVRPRYGEWVWIERMLLTAKNYSSDMVFDIKKQDRQVIKFKINDNV